MALPSKGFAECRSTERGPYGVLVLLSVGSIECWFDRGMALLSDGVPGVGTVGC